MLPVLTNHATVELNVGYGGLRPGVLGTTGSNLVPYFPVAGYYGALGATQTSALDALAVSHLSPLGINGGVSVLVPAYASPGLGINVAGGKRLAPDDLISTSMALTTANAKALGFHLGPGVIDGTIRFSNQFAFDFNPSDGITPESLDFIGVAIHEIGHALGFVSSADEFDFVDGSTGQVDDLWWGYGLDMFRYSAPGQLDWSPDTPSYFSIDGGVSALYDGLFSTGRFAGDGWQASHWKQPSTTCVDLRGVMNPYLCGSKGGTVTALDLALFDAIGWNLNVDVLADPGYAKSTAGIFIDFTAVPEPPAWTILLLAFGLLARAPSNGRGVLRHTDSAVRSASAAAPATLLCAASAADGMPHLR